MIKTITSIPTTKAELRPIILVIERSRSLPFITPRSTAVAPHDVTVSAPLFLGEEQQVQMELDAIQRQRAKALAFSKKESLITWPWRQMAYWFGEAFHAAKKAMFNTGIVQFHVKGGNIAWKMDREGVWALDEGRYLDSLVKVKEV